MLLVVDVGNTNIVLGIYQGTTLIHHWRLATRTERTTDEYGILILSLFQAAKVPQEGVEGAILSSVVPQVETSLVTAIRHFFNVPPLVVGPGIKTGMPIRYDNPKEVGADRIVNAVAAFETLHSAAIVVDFGTATTFDLVGPQGDYRGGAIAPGLSAAMEALYEKTAKLPRIDFARPPSVIGRNTIQSMRSGIYWGYVGLVDGIIKRMAKEADFAELKTIATGGLAETLSNDCRRIEQVDTFLTLKGLKILYERNRQGG